MVSKKTDFGFVDVNKDIQINNVKGQKMDVDQGSS